MKYYSAILLIFAFTFSSISHAESSAMTNEVMGEILKRLNKNTQGKEGYWQLEFEGYPVNVITDKKANRMRIVIPVTQSEQANEKLMTRLMQANFDSALDARYAIAQGVIWSTYIHPLAELSEEQFLSGFAQTVILAKTFGSTFTSGALIFNGGDSAAEHQKLFEEILKKGLAI